MENQNTSQPHLHQTKQNQPDLTTNHESNVFNNQSESHNEQPSQSLQLKETVYIQKHLLSNNDQQTLVHSQLQSHYENEQTHQQESHLHQVETHTYEHLDNNQNQSETVEQNQGQRQNNEYQSYNNEHENAEQKMVDHEDNTELDNYENQTQAFEQFGDVQNDQHHEVDHHEQEKSYQNTQNQPLNHEQNHQTISQQHQQQIPVVQASNEPHQQLNKKQQQPVKQSILSQQPINNVDSSNTSSQLPVYQNQILQEMKLVQQIKPSTQQKEQLKHVDQQKIVQEQIPKKKKSKKKKVQESQPLPVISANSEQGKKQILSEKKIEQKRIVSFDFPKKTATNNEASNNGSYKNTGSSDKSGSSNNNGSGNKQPQVQQKIQRQQPLVASNHVPEPHEHQQVSQIINPSSTSAGIIIFEAQRQRIGSTLDYFTKYVLKHQKHSLNQKQLISNIQQQMQKKRLNKQLILNSLKNYFQDIQSMCKDFYQKSYKYAKNQKIVNPNPMINMREQLKNGYDQMIFLRKSTGNDFHRLGDFINSNIQRSIVKAFTQYWNSVSIAQNKNREKKDEFAKKQKQFNKRISKVEKVYLKGKQGIPQQQDLFIQMTKFISQQRQYRKSLIEYGTGLIPLKKSFIKSEQTLYEQLQSIFNLYKNNCRNIFALHPRQFTQIQKFQKLVKQNNTFEKLSDITDGDYVRSVLVTLQKSSIQNLTDKDFEKVFNLLHFQQIVGNSVELLKGTTSKSFQLKNKAEQVVDTISGNLLIFNKETAQMKQRFVIKNINAKIVQDGVVEIDEVIKGIIFDSNRTFRITFRDNDRAEELICFLNQILQSIEAAEKENKKRST